MDDTAHNTLIYEETPIIEPIEEKRLPQSEEKSLPDPLLTPELKEPDEKRLRAPKHSQNVLIFFMLFVVGVVGSTFVRPYMEKLSLPRLPAISILKPVSQEKSLPTPTVPETQIQKVSSETWNTDTLVSGGKTYSIKLPHDVDPLVCDGLGCLSKGTYLPNKTRFTFSVKQHAAMENFINLIVKDASGRKFDTSPSPLSSYPAVNFSGSFTGTTTGGYTFTQMKGIMIQIAPTITVEVNHFSPNGLTTDFAKDDIIFDEIVRTLTTSAAGSVTPTLTTQR